MGGGEAGIDPPTTTKGDISGFDTTFDRIPIGANTQVLTADSTEALGLKWATPTDIAPPTTTKGDLSGFSTLQARIPIGANTTVLTADSTTSLGLAWTAPAAGYTQPTLGTTVIPSNTTVTTLDGLTLTDIQNLVHDVTGGALAIDFNEDQLQTLTITDNSIFSTSNRAIGKSKTYKLYNSSGSSTYTFTFPAWKFVGTVPTDIAPTKTGILTLTCFGTADTDIAAAYAVEA